jgi:release factor glutamine methyltransferase
MMDAGKLGAEAQAAERLMRADSQTLATALEIPVPEASREIQLLLARALGVNRAFLLAHPEQVPRARASAAYMDMFARRLDGEPVAYILGEREFYGLAFQVTPAVLIPRPETELLVELALARIPEDVPARVLDLGAGTGCVAIVLARLRPAARVIATDLSQDALGLAARNAQHHGVKNLELRLGDWFEPVSGEQFDVIVSNPPYIASADPHLGRGDVRFEPDLALSGGPDGLEALRIIVSQARAHLPSAGSLLVEHGYDQGEAVRSLLRAAGLADANSHIDLGGIPRVTTGRRPS